MSDESFLFQIKRLLVGAPIPSHLAHHERFSRVTGLAVLSSDPLSSVAYATEEILRVLTIGGVAALWLVTPIGAVIATMLDRKSTRLNSSHGYISYAVFCLKKKIK